MTEPSDVDRKQTTPEEHGREESGRAAPGDSPRDEIGDDGVDLTLIRWFLTLTPQERLETAQRFNDGVEALRNARWR